MIHSLLRQIALGVLAVWATLSAVFWLVRLSGDPVAQLLPPEATEAQRAELSASLGLDRPVIEQYLSYLGGILRWDLGQSYFENSPVVGIVNQHVMATLAIAVPALILVLVTAIPLGLAAALNRGGAIDRFVQITGVAGASMPTFWVGLLLIQLFAVALGILPTFGDGSGGWILPTITIAFASYPALVRLTRSSMAQVLQTPYVTTARTKGLSERRVVARTVLRNGSLPIIALLAIELGSLFGGAVITETVFSWPGLGTLTLRAISQRDFPVVQGVVAYVVIIFVIATLLAEVISLAVDPRLRVRTQ
ncbi:ABC transporter permease [Rhodococcus opacus]|uniref:ABC transporter permease n=1 Tax=Rhodococcus opacus TaxID=37919 RepID=UPI001C48BDE7|nr:ABC transporter permease [Rhodococcus opacus]MBV6759075.1 ABC transporter permease [Rhodococcus opacus]